MPLAHVSLLSLTILSLTFFLFFSCHRRARPALALTIIIFCVRMMLTLLLILMICAMLLVLRLPLVQLQCRPICRVDVALFVEG